LKPPKTLPFKSLEQILARYGIRLRPGGEHMMFVSPDGRWKFPIPRVKDVERSYVNSARRRFNLTAEHGVTDEESYGKGYIVRHDSESTGAAGGQGL